MCVRYVFAILLLFSNLNPLEAETHDPFLVTTIPKSGTHLLTKLLTKLTLKEVHRPIPFGRPEPLKEFEERLKGHLAYAQENDCYVRGHVMPVTPLVEILEKQNCKVLFLYRDPRDVAVSMLFWIEEGRYHYGPLNSKSGKYASLTTDQKLMEIISGKKFGYSCVLMQYMRFIPWLFLGSDHVYPIRFEDLVGPEGGGSRQKQREAILGIARHIGLDLSKKEIFHRSKDLFGIQGEGTFRKGQIGAWKEYFNEKHKKAFKELFGTWLVLLGYEKDLEW